MVIASKSHSFIETIRAFMLAIFDYIRGVRGHLPLQPYYINYSSPAEQPQSYIQARI